MAQGQRMPFPFFNQPQDQQQMPPMVGQGSGFVFDPRGYIMTNNHVVQGAQRVTVRTLSGHEYKADVVGADPNSDVAVIKIDPGAEKLPAVTLGNSDDLNVGDWVLALGNPLGLQFTVTAGIVSAKGRNIGIIGSNTPQGASAGIESFIQTDAAINPGNSGGPMVNLLGQVVGINSAIESQTGYNVGIGFAIPIALASKVADDLMKYGAVHRPQLGVLVGRVTQTEADLYHLPNVAGALVTQVQPNTPASRAGIEMGDVIVSLNGQPINDQTDLVARLARMHPGENVSLTLYRNGDSRTVDIKLGEFEQAEPQERTAEGPRSGRDLLGFDVQNLTPQIASQLGYQQRQGVIVTDVSPASPAAPLGLRRGVLIVQLAGKKVANQTDFNRIASTLKPGDPVAMVVVPGPGQPQQLLTFRTSE